MAFEDVNLKEFLQRINNLHVRDELVGELLEFALFDNIMGLGGFIEAQKFSRPINISLQRRTKDRVEYSVSSDKNRIHLISYGIDWDIAGGKISPDNIRGSHYLKMPLVNFKTGSEGRIYFAPNDTLFSFYDTKPLRKPLNRHVLL